MAHHTPQRVIAQVMELGRFEEVQRLRRSKAWLLAKREPLRVVFRDAGFATDSVKINVEQIFNLMSPSTEVKTI